MSAAETPALYFDSNAIVKLYVDEPGSEEIRRLFQESRGIPLASSEVSEIELSSAVWRKYREATPTEVIPIDVAQTALSSFESLCHDGSVLLVLVNREIVRSAATLTKDHALKSLDAIHLASAVLLRKVRRAHLLSPPRFVTFDRVLRKAAIAEGFSVHGDTR